MITEEMIRERISVINGDIEKITKDISDAEKKKLGVDKVKLLEQRYCPIYPERVVNPNSKFEMHKGKKVYFWSSSAIRRWKRDPDKYFAEAVKRGHLKG